MTLSDIIRCPLCGERLTCPDAARSMVCPRGHSYDIARAGYVNLLPPGKGRNAKTGDEREMIRARAAFLRAGYYLPMDDAAAELLSAHMSGGTDGYVFCDMGAGEGTHTCEIARRLHERARRDVFALGFDASKYGAESGCRYARSIGCLAEIGEGSRSGLRVTCLPANLFHLPVADGCADCALSLFAPIAWGETGQILKDGGLLLVASSGREHLMEMRRVLYDEVRLTDFHAMAPDGSGFELLERTALSFPVTMTDGETIWNLFMMTPFYHRVSDAGRERLRALDRLTVTAEMEFSLWRKTGAEGV